MPQPLQADQDNSCCLCGPLPLQNMSDLWDAFLCLNNPIITFLVPRIFRRLLDFWKMFAPLGYCMS